MTESPTPPLGQHKIVTLAQGSVAGSLELPSCMHEMVNCLTAAIIVM